MAARHLDRGREGEAAARRYLTGKGFRILAENWKARCGELDMVAGKGHDLIFVEVKTRAKGGMSSPADGVTMEKRRRLARAAAEYLSRHKLWSRPCRFDLVLVAFTDDGKEPEIEHIENAFEVTDALGRRHASWQPW